MARRAIVAMTPDVLALFCTNGEKHIRIENGSPADAKFIGAYYDHSRNIFDICFESEEFEDIEPGREHPRLLLEIDIFNDANPRLEKRLHPSDD